MVRLKIVLAVTLAVLGLSAAPAQAFGPLMMGGHQHGGDTGHKDSTAGRADAPPVAPQHVAPRDAHRSDVDHGR